MQVFCFLLYPHRVFTFTYICFTQIAILIKLGIIHVYLPFVLEFKFEGFCVDTAKSLVASKDVSFAAHALCDVLCS